MLLNQFGADAQPFDVSVQVIAVCPNSDGSEDWTFLWVTAVLMELNSFWLEKNHDICAPMNWCDMCLLKLLFLSFKEQSSPYFCLSFLFRLCFHLLVAK